MNVVIMESSETVWKTMKVIGVTVVVISGLAAWLPHYNKQQAADKIAQGGMAMYNNAWNRAIECYTDALGYTDGMDVKQQVDVYTNRAECYSILALDARAHSNENNKDNRTSVDLGKADDDLAIMDYTAALRLDPRSDRLYKERGDIYSAEKQLNQAIADYTEGLRRNPESSELYADRGNAYLANGQMALAIADYTEGLHHDPKSDNLYALRGDAYLANGQMDQAIADYNEIIRIKPDYLQGYMMKAEAYKKSGDKLKARESYRAFLSKDSPKSKIDIEEAQRAISELDFEIESERSRAEFDRVRKEADDIAKKAMMQ